MTKTVGILVSSLDDGIYKITDICKTPADEIIIVHQITSAHKEVAYKEFYSTIAKEHIHIYIMYEKGLSKSRNACMQHSTCDYMLLCDDDETILPNAISCIKTYLDKYPTVDIFTFKIKTPTGVDYKNYSASSFYHTKRSAAKISSIEMCISRKWWVTSKLNFDKKFGLGSNFPTSEEYIFLSDALRLQAKALFVPEYITMHAAESSGKKYSEKLLEAKGAVFARTYGFLYPLINLAFALKKIKDYKEHYSFFTCIKLLNRGSKKYLQNE